MTEEGVEDRRDFYCVWFRGVEPWYSTPDEYGYLARLYRSLEAAEEFRRRALGGDIHDYPIRRVRIMPYEVVESDIEDDDDEEEAEEVARVIETDRRVLGLLHDEGVAVKEEQKRPWKEPPPDDLGMMER